MAAAGNDSGQAPTQRRPWRIRVRLLLVIAALFAGATALGGGAGFAVGKIASIGAERTGEATSFHHERWERPNDRFTGGDVDSQ